MGKTGFSTDKGRDGGEGGAETGKRTVEPALFYAPTWEQRVHALREENQRLLKCLRDVREDQEAKDSLAASRTQALEEKVDALRLTKGEIEQQSVEKSTQIAALRDENRKLQRDCRECLRHAETRVEDERKKTRSSERSRGQLLEKVKKLEQELDQRQLPQASSSARQGIGALLGFGSGASAAPSEEQVVRGLVDMELQALRAAKDGESKTGLKKRLLLKWHPDKCVNTTLATRVLQEMQTRREWK